jgi:hypothetical protein
MPDDPALVELPLLPNMANGLNESTGGVLLPVIPPVLQHCHTMQQGQGRDQRRI